MGSRSRTGCWAEAAAEVVGRIRRNICRNILSVCATFSCIFGEAHTLRSAMQSDVQLIEKKGQCSQARESAGTYRNGRTAASGSAYRVRMSEGVRRSSTASAEQPGTPISRPPIEQSPRPHRCICCWRRGRAQGRWSGASGAHSWPHRPLPNGGKCGASPAHKSGP